MIEIAAWTHVGLVRQRNEDAVALPGTIICGSPPSPVITRSALPKTGAEPYTVAVVDGMGGHAGGADASLIAALHLSQTRCDIETALNSIHSQLFDEMDRRPELRSMGATVAGIQVTDSRVNVFNIGDARAYTHRDGYSTLASVDDRSDSGDGAITQSLGGTAEMTRLSVHSREIPLDDSVRILLCSDGLSEHVIFGAIQDALDTADPAAAAGQLISLSLGAGAPDNVSVVVVDLTLAP